MSKRRRVASPKPSTSQNDSVRSDPFATLSLDNSDDEVDVEKVNFFLDLRNTRSFKGSGWAQEKTYRLKADSESENRSRQISLNNSLPQVKEMFEALIDDVSENNEPEDIARVYIDHPDLQSAIIVPPAPLRQVTSERVMSQVESVLHSAGRVLMNEDLNINIAVVKRIGGRGGARLGRYRLDYMRDRKTKKCVIQVPVVDSEKGSEEDIHCLAKAVLVGNLALQVNNEEDPCEKNKLKRKLENLVRGHRAKKLSKEAVNLSNECGVKSDRQGYLDDIPLFEQHLGISICVLSSKMNDEIIYPGCEDFRSSESRIYLYHFKPTGSEYWHFDVIRSMSAFMGKAHYCDLCDVAMSSSAAETHSCRKWCTVCCSKECEILQGREILCSDCNRFCRSEGCFQRHKKAIDKESVENLCSLTHKCSHCNIVFKTNLRKKKHHVCGESFCKNCENWFSNKDDKTHYCYMRGEKQQKNVPEKFIFYDFECTQSEGDHIPNLVIAQTCCPKCESENDLKNAFCNFCGSRCRNCYSWNWKTKQHEKQPCDNGECGKREKVIRGNDVTEEFGKWLIDRQHADCTVIAHNAKAYDNYFILKYLIDHNIKPTLILDGTKVMYMHVGGKGINIRFLDSCMFLSNSLANLPKLFALSELKKGYFPHFFNRPENYGKCFDTLPPKSDYGISTMNEKKFEAFEEWYKENYTKCFDFEKEMEEYCRSDVDILRQVCLRYRSTLKEITGDKSKGVPGIDPFAYISAASVCMGVFRNRFLSEKWQILTKNNSESDCSHDVDSCLCKWKSVWKKNTAQEIKEDVFLDDGKIVKERFVSSMIGLIPSTEYRPKDKYSLEAMSWLEETSEEINDTLHRLGFPHVNIQTALSPHGEKNVLVPAFQNLPPKRYKLDGFYVDPVTDMKVALEFYGCHWHGCPKCYPESQRKEKSECLGKTLQQRYEETLLREKRLRECGFTVKSIWACEYAVRLKEREKFSDDFPQQEDQHISLRDAYYGGRTAALKMYHDFSLSTEMNIVGKYVDFTSLYPWALKYGFLPVGHPLRYSGKQIFSIFSDKISDCVPCEDCDSDNTFRFCPEVSHVHHKLKFFGIAKVFILPPRKLLHPVLPYRSSSGKLLFPLCKNCAEKNNQRNVCNCSSNERSWVHTYCSGELEIALDMGYEILHVYEILSWPENSNELFTDYVDTFLRIKQEASGLPENVQSEKDIERYIEHYREKEGIVLRKENISNSPALRSLAKLMLNSLYGKFGQRTTMKKSHIVNSVPQLCKLVTSPDKNILDFHVLNEDMMHVETEENDHFAKMDLKSNVVISAFTASWARLKLWNVMYRLGERLLYTDTDSLIYISVPGLWEPEIGNFLGELTNELDCKSVGCKDTHSETFSSAQKENHYIVEFVAGGAKNYGYCLNSGQVVCKVRGFTLDNETSTQLNFFSLKQQVLQWFDLQLKTFGKDVSLECEECTDTSTKEYEQSCKDIVIVRTQIAREKLEFRVYNKLTRKRYGVVLDKNQINFSNFTSLPFGF